MKTMIRKQKTWYVFTLTLLISFTSIGSDANPEPNLNYQAGLLQKEVSRYVEIQQQGGWQKISLNKKQYKQGETAPFIRQLKRRLHISHDLSSNDTSAVFTPQLEMAVKKVQRQFGLNENGVVDALLVAALNVPVQSRLQQLQLNLQRSQSLPDIATGRRIIVNIPEYKMYIYENGKKTLEMNVVVGTEKTQTATFSDELTHIVFSPYWNVPSSIVRNEILPKMRRNRRYLANNGYEQTGTENGLPVIRQRPGKNNSLGLVKFLFPNGHAIYFHDTPAKTLFKNRIRAYSHGCVRLEEPTKLAEYLLANDPSWNTSKIADAMNSGKEQWVKLNQPVPVSIIYLTAWVDDEGLLNFRDDVYEMDKASSATNKIAVAKGA